MRLGTEAQELRTQLPDLISQNRVKERINGTKTLLCYTGEQFHSKDYTWNALLKRCRGLIVDTKTKEALNNPIPKLFNIGEQPETDYEYVKRLIETEPYELYHKSNGHLCICSYIGKRWYITTKGSWDMEFVPKDKRIVSKYLKRLDNVQQGMTVMFEMITQYDKHTLYEHEVKRYGKNKGVLLAVRYKDGTDLLHSELETMANVMECPVVDNLTHKDFNIDEAYDEKDTEGYIIRFINSGLRVKIKTKDYLMARYMKEFSAGGKFKKLFKQYAQDIKGACEHIPEEYEVVYEKLVEEYLTRVEDVYNRVWIDLSSMLKLLGITSRSKQNDKTVAEAVSKLDVDHGLYMNVYNSKRPYALVKTGLLNTFDFDAFVERILSKEVAMQLIEEDEELADNASTVFEVTYD